MFFNDTLRENTPHPFSYTNKTRIPTLKGLARSTSSQVFTLDTCILNSSINVLKKVNHSILNNMFVPEDKVQLLKSLYGQIKAINMLGSQKRMFLTNGIKREFEKGIPYLEKEFSTLQKLQNGSSFGFDCEDFAYYEEQVYLQMNMLRGNVIDSKELLDNRTLDLALANFKRTPFCVQKYTLGRNKKTVGDEDLKLLIGTSILNSIDMLYSGKLSLITCDWDFLVQGPIFLDGDLYVMPDIYFGISNNQYFNSSFFKCVPPNVSSGECLDYIEKH